MEIREIEIGDRVEYETERDEIIEGVVLEIISTTQVLIENRPGTLQKFIAHPQWLTRIKE